VVAVGVRVGYGLTHGWRPVLWLRGWLCLVGLGNMSKVAVARVLVLYGFA
jgi:hypothetical protein